MKKNLSLLVFALFFMGEFQVLKAGASYAKNPPGFRYANPGARDRKVRQWPDAVIDITAGPYIVLADGLKKKAECKLAMKKGLKESDVPACQLYPKILKKAAAMITAQVAIGGGLAMGTAALIYSDSKKQKKEDEKKFKESIKVVNAIEDLIKKYAIVDKKEQELVRTIGIRNLRRGYDFSSIRKIIHDWKNKHNRDTPPSINTMRAIFELKSGKSVGSNTPGLFENWVSEYNWYSF